MVYNVSLVTIIDTEKYQNWSTDY